MDKLGTASQDPTTAVMVDLAALGDVVNGPEDLPDWDAIDWRGQEAQVRRLRQRIFTATQAGDLTQVRNLQKPMLRSRANTLVSVRRVTQRNTTSRRMMPARPRGLLEPCAATSGTHGSEQPMRAKSSSGVFGCGCAASSPESGRRG